MKRDIKSMLPAELHEYFKSAGEPEFRVKQVFSWLHSGVKTFSDMTNLPVKLRGKLDEDFLITVPVLIETYRSSADDTVKYLWGIQEGDTIETVMMDYRHGCSICVSSQVGCAMGCTFCASSITGLKRDLAASEIVDQVIFSQLLTQGRVSNIVLMGMGEPLDNFDNVIRFIELISHPYGINIGARHITLSTCGLTENIDRLSDYSVQLSLAISLHATDDETRNKLIPRNRDTSINELLDACRRYFKKTGRRITYEYALIDGVNDSPDQALQLSKLLRKTGSHLNLIMLSSVPERAYTPSSKKNVEIFTKILSQNEINFTVRRSLGADIEAACGQLRRKNLAESVNGVMGHN